MSEVARWDRRGLGRVTSTVVGMVVGLAACGPDAGNRPGETGAGLVTVTAGDSGETDDGPSGTAGDKLDVGADTDAPPMDDDEECASYSEAAQNELQPADIIFIVDNSGSMGDEADAVQANINTFSQEIIDSGVDARVVLISSYPNDGNGICVAPPLGIGDCANNNDSNPPQFLHINDEVDSHDALQRLLANAGQWMPVVRPGSGLHIVVVTDDESNLDALSFDNQFKALDPDFDDYKLHGIVSMQDCDDAADIGQVYISLGQLTGGLVSDLCLQNFQPVFDLLATEVISGSVLSCEWAIPEPPEGEDFDPDKVNVEFDDGSGNTLLIGRVDSAAECPNVTDGWHYDDPVNPTLIVACPQTCDRIQGAMMATIAIQLGCATEAAG
jgi:hypothetical protein